MNKYFLISIVHIFLILSKESFAGQYFDLETVSDSIVGKLWRKAEVPDQNIKRLFELVEESKISKEMPVDDINKDNLDEFINEWKDSIIDTSEQRKHAENQNAYENIEDFVGKVHKLEGQFSPQAIGGSLYIILDKY